MCEPGLTRCNLHRVSSEQTACPALHRGEQRPPASPPVLAIVRMVALTPAALSADAGYLVRRAPRGPAPRQRLRPSCSRRVTRGSGPRAPGVVGSRQAQLGTSLERRRILPEVSEQ
jgi:hypothetical protein